MQEDGITKAAQCPTCLEMLDKFPARKTTGKNCGSPIYKKTHPNEGTPILANEMGIQVVEKEYARRAAEREFIAIALEFCSEKEINKHRIVLGQKFEKQPSARDVAWKALNDKILHCKDLMNRKFYLWR